MRPDRAPMLAGPDARPVLCDLRVVIDGNRVTITAIVNAAGLPRLRRKLDALADFMADDPTPSRQDAP